MGTGFDFTRLDDDFFLAAPDFSANAKLAASADLLPPASWETGAADTSDSISSCATALSRARTRTSASISITPSPAYAAAPASAYGVCSSSAASAARLLRTQPCSTAGSSPDPSGITALRVFQPPGSSAFTTRTAHGPAWTKIPGVSETRPLPRTVLLIAPGAAPSAPPQSNYKKRLLIKKFITIRNQHAGLF